MKILNNSIVDTVIEYANVKFGVELEKDTVAAQLKERSFGELMQLTSAIKDEDNDQFSDLIDLSIDEAYGTSTTSQPSSATIRSQGTLAATDNRRATNAELKASRQTSTQRTVAGSNKTSTGSRSVADPSDNQRNQNSAQANSNSQEIDRLKDLVMKVARGK